jgi:preprotein translocase subunit SecD
LFMFFKYRIFGLIADLTLIVNKHKQNN